jgi:hypothetical protein
MKSHLLRRETFWASVILLGLLEFTFFPFTLGNKTFLESARDVSSILPNGAWAGPPGGATFTRVLDPGAGAWVSEPLLELIRRDYVDEKTLPLWNPYAAYGSPLAADMQSQPFYPLTIAIAFHHTLRAYNFYILLRLFLAGICSYLYIRLFVSFVPALAAGVTSMFAGYFILYITLPHLSVEVLLPALLLTGEHLLRNSRFRSMIAFAAVIVLVLLGGMPESSLLSLTFCYAYLAFRIATDSDLRPRYFSKISYLLIAGIVGFSICAPLLLSFREYMSYDYDVHQLSTVGGILPGMFHDPRGLSVFTYFFPLLYGSAWSGIIGPAWNGLRNYVGLISIFLIAIAICSISFRRDKHDQNLNLLTCFFSFFAAAVVMKRYGLPFVNFIGAFPLFKFVLFYKYQEVILSICVSMLCAIGLERLARGQVSILKGAAALTTASLIVPFALILSRNLLSKEITTGQVNPILPVWAISVPTALLFCLALSLILSKNKDPSPFSQGKAARNGLVLSTLVLLTIEMLFSFMMPAYYAWSTLATRANNPYIGAPFVNRLKKLAGTYRIFGREGVLVPKWSSAFGLFDIRDLDAMYYKRYLPFVRAFQPKEDVNGEIADRFIGGGPYEFNAPLEQRLLQLSSVKYFATMTPVVIANSAIIDEILQQNKGRLTPGKERFVGRTEFTLDGISRVVLGEHPPYDRLPYRFKVDQNKELFHFSYGLNPAAFNLCGDGVEFILEIKDSAGKIRKLFSNYIDPKHNVNERRWFTGNLDLTRYRGQSVGLLLSTNPGPRGDNCADWAVWSDLRFNNSPEPFKQVYDGEAKIYEYDHVLPRAAIYFNAKISRDKNEVLKSLVDPSTDLFKTVLLEQSNLDKTQTAWVNEINRALPAPVQPATITSYRSQAVTITASLGRSGILVLNDSDYPGWIVSVDGHEEREFTANYLFRGVLLRPGTHTVRFVYRPTSLRLGAAISSASLLSLMLFAVFRRGRETDEPATCSPEVVPQMSKQGERG